MAGGKETPRQKMIGLMYLVLTAMLALNVSKSILNGYLSVNESLEKSKKAMYENNSRVTKAFEGSINGNPGAAPYYKEATASQKDIQTLFLYIDDVKGNMVRYVEGFEENIKVLGDTVNLRNEPHFANIGDYDKPTTVLLGTGDAPAKGPLTADDLRQKMEALHAKLIAQVDRMQKTDGLHLLKEDAENLKKKIDIIKPVASGFVEDGITYTWEMDLADHLPMAAVFVNLNKLQSDLRNVEAEILQVYSAASGKLSIKPDRLIASIVAPSNYISAGQPYKSEIFLSAAFSKLGEGDMEVMMGVDSSSAVKGQRGNPIKLVAGRGQYEVVTSATGDQKYSGVIKFKKPDGSFEYYPFTGEYKVAKSAVAVSAEQMNVFYRGVVNPVAAGAAGVSPNDIVINASGAGVKYVARSEPGKYDFTFTGIGECLITVSKKGPDGVKPVGPPQKFRVKPLPKPEPKIGPKFAPSEIKKSELSTVGAIGAGANGFDFAANYVVQSYEVTGKVKGNIKVATGNGSNLAADAKAILNNVEVNTKLFIDLKVKGPDGIIYSTACSIKVIR
jgi:gliding motility-associated protein GldM